jgi:hypothetical protein
MLGFDFSVIGRMEERCDGLQGTINTSMAPCLGRCEASMYRRMKGPRRLGEDGPFRNIQWRSMACGRQLSVSSERMLRESSHSSEEVRRPGVPSNAAAGESPSTPCGEVSTRGKGSHDCQQWISLAEARNPKSSQVMILSVCLPTP